MRQTDQLADSIEKTVKDLPNFISIYQENPEEFEAAVGLLAKRSSLSPEREWRGWREIVFGAIIVSTLILLPTLLPFLFVDDFAKTKFYLLQTPLIACFAWCWSLTTSKTYKQRNFNLNLLIIRSKA